MDDVSLPRLIDVTQYEVLVGGESHRQLISLDHSSQSLLQVTLEAPILDENAVGKLAIALLLPTQEVLELPLGKRPAKEEWQVWMKKTLNRWLVSCPLQASDQWHFKLHMTYK